MTTGFIQAWRVACASALVGMVLAAPAASAATFPAAPGSLGAIPDAADGVDCGPAAAGPPRDVQFNVSGLPALAPSSVGVSMTFSPAHSFAGDLDVVLIAPDGATATTIFARTGSFGLGQCGTPATASGPYTFADGAHDSPSFWDAASSSPIPAGAYRASVPGGGGAGGDNALITPAFAAVANPNGVWTLRFRDEGSTDTGSVSAASLSLNDPDTIAPLAPTLTTQPGSPANFNAPEISGIAEAGSQVRVYANAACAGAPAAAGSATALDAGMVLPVADNTTTVFAATATDAAGNTSPCSAALTYVEDSASAAPVLTTDPPSPGKDRSPRLRGTVEAGSQVKIFKNGGCTGTAFATRTAAAFTTTGIVVSVAPDAPTGLSAIATDPLDNVSPCGAYVYVQDSMKPRAPQFTATAPGSPANANQPRLRGTAELGTVVNVYPRTSCSGAPIASGGAADLAGAGIPITVADNSRTTLVMSATDAAGNSSLCSLRRVYVEDSRAPTTSITRAASTTRTRRASARVSFSFRSNESGAHFQCRIGAARLRSCRSPAAFTLRRGRRTFTVVAIDAAGNRDKTPARRTVRVLRR
jgi:hypothetical protein